MLRIACDKKYDNHIMTKCKPRVQILTNNIKSDNQEWIVYKTIDSKIVNSINRF